MKAFLLLADGTVFEGESVGAAGTRVGEVVFNTGMAAYQELLTDPACAGQIVTQTYPLTGNYGVNDVYAESNGVKALGYIAREVCDAPSNFRSKGTLGDYLAQQGVVGLTGIDTRSLTRIMREHGSMNGALTTEYESAQALRSDAALMEKIRSYRVENAVESVTVKAAETFCEGTSHVAVLDFGVRRSVLAELEKRGCKVTVLPASATAQDIKALAVDGILLSGGPGDPADNKEIIENLKEIAALKKPMFGYGLGHQMLALAMGAKTEKIARGHRGANQPVYEVKSGRTYITSQNHGYAVVAGTEKDAGAHVSYVNANDKTIEGLCYEAMPCFTVQFYPELNGSTADANALLDEFVTMMKGGC